MSPRRQLAVLAALLTLFAAYDFSGRVFVSRDDALRTVAAPAIEPLPTHASAEQIRKRLATWLPELSGSLDPAAAGDASDNWRFELVGVFRKDGEQFALVSARRSDGGAAELVQVKEGEALHGSTVQQIESTRLTLLRDATSEELQIFGPPQPISPAESAGATAGSRGGRAARDRDDDDDDDDVRRSRGASGAATSQPGARSGAAAATAGKSTSNRAAGPAATKGAPVGQPVVTVPRPAAASAKPATALPAKGADAKVVESQELKPGEEVKLPWDLPVVEGDGARPEKKR